MQSKSRFPGSYCWQIQWTRRRTERQLESLLKGIQGEPSRQRNAPLN